MIAGETNYVGVTEVTSTTATIDVTSNGQTTVSIGGVEKFDVNDDNIYDISVTLNGIDSTKAELTMKYIQEAVPAETEEKVTEEVVEDELPRMAPPEEEGGSNLTWLWIVIAVVVIAIIVSVVMSKKK